MGAGGRSGRVDGMPSPRVAVVGGGISGLAAAWELTRLLPRGDAEAQVVVLEGSGQVGGKIRTATVAGHDIDVGAESMLARRPEALDLAVEAGLAADVVHPTGAPASVWSRGRRWPLPAGTLMGVPPDPAATLGLLTEAEVARIEAEENLDPVIADVSVGDFVAARVGPAVVDRLVEPLLAGVYAGHARRLSLQATVPALWAAATTGTSVVAAAAAAAATAPASAPAPAPASAACGIPVGRQGLGGAERAPVFAGYRGGLGRFVQDLTDRLRRRGVTIRTTSTVRQLEPASGGWRLTLGPASHPQSLTVDAVVLATPPASASRLLRPVAPAAAAELGAMECASVAVVSLALPRSADLDLSGSGFLVPPSEPLIVKAATFSSSKWAWLAAADAQLVFLRASLGRAGESAVLQREDAELVELARRDLGSVLGTALPPPVDAHLQRWGGGIPQYAVGHADRVARIHADVDRIAGLELAGAAYQGVGIPACIASGRRAARQVATQLRGRPAALRE